MPARQPVKILETDRLILRRLDVEDAGFILALVNEPSWLRFIGDKGVRSLEDARNYIRKGPMDSYERFGFGLYLTELKGETIPIGMCGLLKRESLNDVDLGFAFLPQFWRRGFGYESASAVIAYGKTSLGLKRLVALTAPDNESSIGLLEKLGFTYVRMVKLSEESPESRLFSRDLA
jgi:RimJ/RimL family protein N-acetyltransferase